MGEGRVFLVPLADPKATLEKATEFIHGNIGDDLPLIVGTVEYQES